MARRPEKPPGHLPGRPPAKFSTHTPFGQWFELLTRRRFVPKAAIDGIPVGFWHGFPVEEAVANALMLVILDLARKADRRVESSDDVFAIAAQVDTMVGAGLSVGYANVQAAADSFVKRVVAPVHRAALAGFRPDAPPTMAAWREFMAGRLVVPSPPGRARVQDGANGAIGPFLGRPAAIFIVRLINCAIRFRQRLETRLAELERANRLHGAATWIPDSDFDSARRAIRRLDIRVERDAERSRESGRPAGGRAHERWGRWLDHAVALEACGKRIARYKKWPVRLEAPLRGMPATSVSEGWLDTVVLMSIARAKGGQDLLTQSAFWKGVSMISEVRDAENGFASLRARIARAMKARLSGSRPDLLEEVMEGIDRSLEKLPGAGEAYGKMMAGTEAALREIESLSGEVRKIDGRLAKSRRDRAEILDEREEAADRLARLQQRVDRVKSEFREIHFPAIFLIETNPEEALAGRTIR